MSLSGIFYNCPLLTTIPDISRWNISNVTTLGGMFFNCSSLISLPDISNWNTNKIENISLMFSNCLSLISFPNMTKWNTRNLLNIESVFSDCLSIILLPGIYNYHKNNKEKVVYKSPDFVELNRKNDLNVVYGFFVTSPEAYNLLNDSKNSEKLREEKYKRLYN